MYRQSTLEKIEKIEDSLIEPSLKVLIDEETEILKEEEKKWKEKFNNITAKFIYNDITIIIPAKKTETIKDLKLHAIEEFKIDVKPHNARIRTVNSATNKMQEIFEDENAVIFYLLILYLTYLIRISRKA